MSKSYKNISFYRFGKLMNTFPVKPQKDTEFIHKHFVSHLEVADANKMLMLIMTIMMLCQCSLCESLINRKLNF